MTCPEPKEPAWRHEPPTLTISVLSSTIRSSSLGIPKNLLHRPAPNMKFTSLTTSAPLGGMLCSVIFDHWRLTAGSPRRANAAAAEVGRKPVSSPACPGTRGQTFATSCQASSPKRSEWGALEGREPRGGCALSGRRKRLRQHQKITTEETRRLLEALPLDVRRHLRGGLVLHAADLRGAGAFSGSTSTSRRGVLSFASGSIAVTLTR